MHRFAVVTLLILLTTSAYAQTDAVAARIDRILREAPLIDGHNDLPWQYEERVKDHLAQIDLRQDQSKLTPPLHTDIARLRQGRIRGAISLLVLPTAAQSAGARPALARRDHPRRPP